MRHLQFKLMLIDPSLWRVVNDSASERIVLSKLRLTPRLLIMRVAHFINLIPILL